MAERPVVMIHGWSATSEGLEPLAGLVRGRLGAQVLIVRLADYISMDDEVRFDDLVSAMDRAWDAEGLPRTKGSVDALVHSAGALVMRDWLDRNFGPDESPVAHLVMLAPANFGSPLAHKGRSFGARALRGFIAKKPEGQPFETGTQILKGLELASPYTWDLAVRDRFGERGTRYQPGNVLCTVLVGNAGYRGIRAIANEEGSDGTVRIATANMNCLRVAARFPAHPEELDVGHDVAWSIEESTGSTAFGVLDGHNHSTIKLSHLGNRSPRSKRDRRVLEYIVESLSVGEADFREWRGRLAARNEELLPKVNGRNVQKHGFQNTVVHVEDQYGVGVDDYLLEFYKKEEKTGRTAERFHRFVINGVHKYCDDHSYRSIYIDCTRLAAEIDKVGNKPLSISLTASPEFDPPRTPVGFETIADEHIGGLRIGRQDIGKFFAPHRTVLVSLELERQQSPGVFAWRSYP